METELIQEWRTLEFNVEALRRDGAQRRQLEQQASQLRAGLHRLQSALTDAVDVDGVDLQRGLDDVRALRLAVDEHRQRLLQVIGRRPRVPPASHTADCLRGGHVPVSKF